MLTVYTTRTSGPLSRGIDLSTVPLDDLVASALAVYTHHADTTIWFGYLDGWMLTPQEEVLLRKVLRKFECSLCTAFPLSLSQAWKNEIRTIYTTDLNGTAEPHDHGRPLHPGSSAGYGQTRS